MAQTPNLELDDDALSQHADFPLTREQVQELSSAHALAALFGKLSYNTNERIEQTPEAMELTSDRLRSAITRIERIALNEDFDTLQVYLFELKRLTVSLRNELVQGFRNKTGNYLLVLTCNYEQLDFVLIERYAPVLSPEDVTQQPLAGFPTPTVRPRVLQVERRNPDPVALRVLRRFTFTESDTLAQYEKLLNAYIIATWSEPYFNNRALFSDYYLTVPLPQDKIWNDTTGMTSTFRNLRDWYEDAHEAYNNKPNAVIRETLFLPILQKLGFRAQAVQKSNDEREHPDYLLFDEKTPASPDPLAVCLTYPWGRNLDGRDEKRDHETSDENPGAVVVSLLDQGQAEWAIVTNGIDWRLYSARAHSRATNYYEINLQEMLSLLERDEREKAFHYFWLFFRAAAFIPQSLPIDGETRLISWLDELLIKSDSHARALGERLKERIFEKIFPCFAQGFIDHARQNKLLPANLNSLSEEERNRLLEPYYTATLTFLYRLLFLLYAESRDLLPVRQERSYYVHSLKAMTEEIANHAGKLLERVEKGLEHYSETGTKLYDGLTTLFAAIDKGNREFNVPVYNGGLFMTEPPSPMPDEPPEFTVARFLKEHKVTDRQLALGLDRMARDIDEKHERVQQATSGANSHRHDLIFIDYKSLGVRHLGSIYEGLLEFKLRLAIEMMAVVAGKRTDEIIPLEEARRTNRPLLKERQDGVMIERLIKPDSVYLENDRRERKATGSYYTPDYIVKYIIEQTIGPILDKKFDDLRPLFRDAEKRLRTEQDKFHALRQKVFTERDDPRQAAYIAFQKSINEAFFDLKVLDPAMGSGHFLVEAVDYITDKMIDFLNHFRSWNPIYYELDLTKQKIEEAMEKQEVTIDVSKLTRINLLKRRVLKSCIYGVDVNMMAVELSKVSLWLDCFTLGAPLSFLDHHMKHGNSLIGADLREVLKGIESKLFGFQHAELYDAAKAMSKVSKLPDATAEEIAESRASFQKADNALAPHHRLFNVWLSQYFGNHKKTQDIASQHARAIADGDYTSVENESDLTAIQMGLRIAEERHFFHWELEFPEVFIDDTGRKENGGFDVVIGNPPYDELSEHALGRVIDETQFLASDASYKIVSGGRLNWYHYFMIRAIKLLKPSGSHSFIVPMSIMSDQFTLSLRRWLLENYQPVFFDAFPQKDNPKKRIFFEAKLPTCIYLISKEKSSHKFRVSIHPANEILKESPTYYPDLAAIKVLDSTNLSIPQVSEKGWQILEKCAINPNLGKLADVAARPTSGEIVFNQQFRKYLTEDASYTLILRGSHVQRYELVDEAKQGEPVYLKKDLYLKDARPGSKAFDHLEPRVVYQECAAIDNWRRVIATLLPPNLVCGHKICYFVDYKISLETLLAIFSSKLVDWYVTALSTNNSLPAYLIGSIRFPVFNMAATPAPERTQALTRAQQLYQHYLQAPQDPSKLNDILAFVTHHLSQQPEASDIVHDLLAFLAEEMLRLNKDKRALQQAFIVDLVAMLHIKPDKKGNSGIDALTNRNKLLDFPGDYQKNEPELQPDELWEIVAQKNRPRVVLTIPHLKERIYARYDQALKAVLPLKAHLKATDTLIDQIVYKLYGLTDDEIKIVEGQ